MTLEAKAGLVGVPPQHVAEFLVMVLARMNRWMIELGVTPRGGGFPVSIEKYGIAALYGKGVSIPLTAHLDNLRKLLAR